MFEVWRLSRKIGGWFFGQSVKINVSLVALFGINVAAALDFVSGAAVRFFKRNAAVSGAGFHPKAPPK